MDKGIYFESFSCRDDVFANFAEPDAGQNIIAAEYDTPPYEGYAKVLYEEGGKFYEVNGSHCSCYGLEGQWAPEEVPLKALRMRAEGGDSFIAAALSHAEANQMI